VGGVQGAACSAVGRLFFRASAIAGWIVSGSCALLYIEYALAYSAITLLQPLAFLVLELSDRCPCR